MLKEAVDTVILPVMDELISAISNMAVQNAGVPMLSRTHGQVKTHAFVWFSPLFLGVGEGWFREP